MLLTKGQRADGCRRLCTAANVRGAYGLFVTEHHSLHRHHYPLSHSLSPPLSPSISKRLVSRRPIKNKEALWPSTVEGIHLFTRELASLEGQLGGLTRRHKEIPQTRVLIHRSHLGSSKNQSRLQVCDLAYVEAKLFSRCHRGDRHMPLWICRPSNNGLANLRPARLLREGHAPLHSWQ